MATLELSAGLALLAGLCSALQALAVEYDPTSGDFAADRSPSLTAAVISIVVSVAVFWALLVARGVSLAGVSPLDVPGAMQLADWPEKRRDVHSKETTVFIVSWSSSSARSTSSTS